MADKKWSTLTQGSALTGPEIMRMVQSGLDRYLTPDMIVTFLGSSTIKTPGKYRPTGSYETQAWSNAAGSNYTTAAGSLRAFSWLLQDALTFTNIKFRVNTGQASAKFRIGIYTAAAGTFYPDALVAGTDIEEYDVASSTTSRESGAVSITIQPGWYWVATNCSHSSVVIEGFDIRSAPPRPLADIASAVPFTPNRYLVAAAYGVMPSTFPGSAVLAGAAYPCIGFKVP